ncbi:MAG: hypothetical protein EOM02_13735, partial [Synergistales bacterium]|nr:hypothetical protein [Synergistales bacterium]
MSDLKKQAPEVGESGPAQTVGDADVEVLELPITEDAERLCRIVNDDVERGRALQTELQTKRDEHYKLYRAKSLGNEREG